MSDAIRNFRDIFVHHGKSLEKIYEIFDTLLEIRGYTVERMARDYQVDFEVSIVLFLKNQFKQKVLDVYIYNIDEFYAGI